MKWLRWLLMSVLVMLTVGCIGGGIDSTYTLIVNQQGEGSINLGTGVHRFEEPEAVTLKATPAAGWRFVGWEADEASTVGAQEITVQVDRRRVVTAMFAERVSTGVLQGRTVVIDAGHGGRDVGAVGHTGYLEKDFTLSVAQAVESLLHGTDATVVMTRNDDSSVTLAQRVSISNEAGADFFLSIHANGHSGSSAAGTETFHDGTWKAKQFALDIQRDMVSILGRPDRRVEDWSNRLYVLRHTQAPAVLIEPAFLTNPIEEQLLMEVNIQNELAEALYQNLIKHID